MEYVRKSSGHWVEFIEIVGLWSSGRTRANCGDAWNRGIDKLDKVLWSECAGHPQSGHPKTVGCQVVHKAHKGVEEEQSRYPNICLESRHNSPTVCSALQG